MVGMKQTKDPVAHLALLVSRFSTKVTIPLHSLLSEAIDAHLSSGDLWY
jgi:hypothetical protein